MIKMWRCLLSYFLVAIAISCGKHNGQLGMQSREKTALKIAGVAKKSTEEPSNQPKKKKRKSQSKNTWWNRWIKFCKFFLPISCFFYAVGGQVVLENSKCNYMSCDLFHPENNYKTNFPFLLKVPENLSLENGTNIKLLFNGFFNDEYPEKIRKGACHILAKQDINITSSNQNTTFCIAYLKEIQDFFSDTIKSVTSIESLRQRNFEPQLNHLRVLSDGCIPNFSAKNSDSVSYYPEFTLLENRSGEWFYHTWNTDTFWYNKEAERKGEGTTIEFEKSQVQHSPQGLFRKINEQCENIQDCTKRFRKEAVAILNSGKIKSYCSDSLHTVGARHWISSAAEYLFFANYLEALEKVRNYAKEKGFCKWLNATFCNK